MGQGADIQRLADVLSENNWQVAYVCIPNRVHTRVVPIPTAGGGSEQRYPDIVATDGKRTLLVEVEPRLTEDSAPVIVQRFRGQVESLSNTSTWSQWREAVLQTTGVPMPRDFTAVCKLVVLRPGKSIKSLVETFLTPNNIVLATHANISD